MSPAPVALRARRLPMLGGAIGLGLALAVAALASGRTELVAVGAPFVLAAVAALAAPVPALDVALAPQADRCVEGDRVVVRATLVPHHDLAHVEVWVPCEALGVEGGAQATWAGQLTAGVPVAVEWVLEAGAWGVGTIGPVFVRAEGPAGLVRWEGTGPDAYDVRIVPADATLRRLLAPARTTGLWGAHLGPRRGEGLEPADIREHGPGDHTRAVNWRVTARTGRLHVTERLIEDTTDVVVLLDTFADARTGEAPQLRRALTAAIAIAGVALRGRDRVGVVRLGGALGWLTPGTGAGFGARLVDQLLGVQARWTAAERSLSAVPPRALPPRSLVVAVTALGEARLVDALVDLAGRGQDLAVIAVEPFEGVATPDDDLGPAALGLWRLRWQARVRTLADAGIAVATWPADRPLDEVMVELSRRRLRPARLAPR